MLFFYKQVWHYFHNPVCFLCTRNWTYLNMLFAGPNISAFAVLNVPGSVVDPEALQPFCSTAWGGQSVLIIPFTRPTSGRGQKWTLGAKLVMFVPKLCIHLSSSSAWKLSRSVLLRHELFKYSVSYKLHIILRVAALDVPSCGNLAQS